MNNTIPVKGNCDWSFIFFQNASLSLMLFIQFFMEARKMFISHHQSLYRVIDKSCTTPIAPTVLAHFQGGPLKILEGPKNRFL